jgi:hypothetical protein
MKRSARERAMQAPEPYLAARDRTGQDAGSVGESESEVGKWRSKKGKKEMALERNDFKTFPRNHNFSRNKFIPVIHNKGSQLFGSVLAVQFCSFVRR